MIKYNDSDSYIRIISENQIEVGKLILATCWRSIPRSMKIIFYNGSFITFNTIKNRF